MKSDLTNKKALIFYFVLLVQGIYSQFFQAVLLRELIVRFSGLEATVAIAFGSILLWTSLGCAAAIKYRKIFKGGVKLPLIILCAMSTLSALCSFLFAALAPPILKNEGMIFSLNEMLIFCLLAPIPFAFINGAVFGSVSQALKKDEAGKCYAVDSLGDTLGGLIFSLILAGFSGPLKILGIYGLVLPCLALIFLVQFRFGKKLRPILFLLTICVIAVSAFASLNDKTVSICKWTRLLRGYIYNKSIETPQGRIDFLSKASGKKTEMAAYKDGSLIATLPNDDSLSFPPAVFASLQPDRKDLKVLAIVSPFSNVPEILLQLPQVESVDLLCPDAELVRASRRMLRLPGLCKSFKTINEDPRAFLEKPDGAHYDLIILFDLIPNNIANNRFFTERFYKAAAKKLCDGGVFVTSMSSSSGFNGESTKKFNASIIKTMKKAFSRIAIAPGGDKLIAAGNSDNVSADFAELDKRIGKYMKKFIHFPEGMMSIAFSQSEQKRESKEIQESMNQAELNTDTHPSLPFLYLGYRSRILSGDVEDPGILVKTLEWLYKRWLATAIILLAVYLVARFLLSRKMTARLTFASFENGFYAMGAELLLLFAYQASCGALYRDLAAAVGIFIGGAALGAWGADKSKLFRQIFMLAAFIIPFAVLPVMEFPYLYARLFIITMLALAGASVGTAYTEFNKRSGVKSGARLWSSEMFGGAVGIAFVTLFLLPAGGYMPAAVLLAFLRLPLLLSAKK